MALSAKIRLSFVCLLIVGTRPSFAVKSLKLGIPKDQSIVLEVPSDQWVTKETSWTEGLPIAVLRVDGDFVKSRSWENGKLPVLTNFHIEKAQECGTGVMSGRIVGCPLNWTQIEMRSPKAWVKIQFAPEVGDVEAALKNIAFIGSLDQFEASAYLHDKVFLPNESKLFASLPELRQEDRYAIFQEGVRRGFDISSGRFKERNYLNVFVPQTTTFNTLRVSQDQRVAELVRDVVLPEAKVFLPYIKEKSVGGLAFFLSIPAYNFVTGGETKFDSLCVYLSTIDLQQFAESDITSQKLIDSSFVLLNGDRTEVHF